MANLLGCLCCILPRWVLYRYLSLLDSSLLVSEGRYSSLLLYFKLSWTTLPSLHLFNHLQHVMKFYCRFFVCIHVKIDALNRNLLLICISGNFVFSVFSLFCCFWFLLLMPWFSAHYKVILSLPCIMIYPIHNLFACSFCSIICLMNTLN